MLFEFFLSTTQLKATLTFLERHTVYWSRSITTTKRRGYTKAVRSAATN